MRKIIGLDLGVSSCGFAYVKEAEVINEKSEIMHLGVRVYPLTVDEQNNFEKGKSITTNAKRQEKHSIRINLQRYKLRREHLVDCLKKAGFIDDDTILHESGNRTTFETYRLRAKAVTDEISLSELARVLLMINKKRGYKSNRKMNNSEEGSLVDGMEVAKYLCENDVTPGQYAYELLSNGNKHLPDFYQSDYKDEFEKIWNFQKAFYPEILTDDFKKAISGKNKTNTSKMFFARYDVQIAQIKEKDKRLQALGWRCAALTERLDIEQLAYVVCDLNGLINNSSNYLGKISDRSKELYFQNLTVGQYQMKMLDENPNASLKNMVFYRQDYLDEFERIWETQAKYHPELTRELKKEICNMIIFYQRPLKSMKGLVGICELERKQVEVEIDGNKKIITVGSKVCPKSSPMFQEFRIWQRLNDIKIKNLTTSQEYFLNQDQKELLAKELEYKSRMTKQQMLKCLSLKPKEYDMNFKEVNGNETQAMLFDAYRKIIECSGNRIIDCSGNGEYDFSKMSADEIHALVKTVFDGLGYNTGMLDFDAQTADISQYSMYRLWHLLYSYESDKSAIGNETLVRKIQKLFGFESDEYAKIIAGITFKSEYGNLSAKAIKNILPFMKEGNNYSTSCAYAGYNHSVRSLTKEEIASKQLKTHLEILPKNSLRNPVVEKGLNQMINVVNYLIDEYGQPDEIRVELARELKKSAKEREDMSDAISKSNDENNEYRKILEEEFGIVHVSKNDILRYKLYLELKENGFRTLYSNTYIPREKLFSRDFDIEHIIPQARAFDDSFSNKTLECRSINLEKSDSTAFDYVTGKYGQDGAEAYRKRVNDLYEAKQISKTKMTKLLMTADDIPADFINRDLCDTQYIAKKAKEILESVAPVVVTTTGSVTERLREDWQLVDVMKELNWDKYDKLGLTETYDDKDGKPVCKIKDWTKRNDHRHHAMDALVIAFTKQSFVQYLNNLNARSDRSGVIYGIEKKEMYRDKHNKLRFKPPFPLDEFRAEAKRHLQDILVSVKSKNKVVTRGINKTKCAQGFNTRVQLTPRGQLHNETVYGKRKIYVSYEEKVGSSFTADKIATVANKKQREALLERLHAYGDDAKKAFGGKNSLDKNPLWLNEYHTECVPLKVKCVGTETVYTVRVAVDKDLKVDNVMDPQVKKILQQRLDEYGGNAKKAFSNLDENPIWLNQEKGIKIKRVAVKAKVSNPESIHMTKDKNGNDVPVDYVLTSNNHHAAFYVDKDGKIHDEVVTFKEAVNRAVNGKPVVYKDYNKDIGWKFLFSMMKNEYFVFPNADGFNPKEIDLTDEKNYHLISPNLFRVQIISKNEYHKGIMRSYMFRHHLETTVNVDIKDVTYKQLSSLSFVKDIVKVRINHIGKIVVN